ncbi:FecR family protein [Chitinophaga sp. CF118]|uniref:FecR family protein n=1 Tax=Chitinophaga sp. CF118 TaxID=1884367 RepID=UPI0008E9307F|nr:FecR domain-containing protein [Chitinophaga sp. CF118]SFD03226.1 FecR family protein [Chitinophaga sp. CF118]
MSLLFEMDIQRETIYQLLLLKLTGSLEEKEEGYINSLIESDPEVWTLWNEIQADFAAPFQQEALQNFDTESLLATVSEEMIRRKQRRVRQKKTLFLSVVMLVGVGIFIYVIMHTASPVENNRIADASKKVLLQMADGEQVNLSDSIHEQTTDHGTIALSNTNGLLSYKANEENSAKGTIIVPAGKDYRIRLADGTVVWMNSGSQLQFPFRFSGSSREITITGEAFIKVAANPTLPFIVHTQHTVVQVLGTSFNVNSYDSGKVTVSLTEGAVKMKTDKSEVLLKPGYQATVTANKEIDTCVFDEENDLAWLKDQYIFRHKTLKEIIPVLERWFDVQITFDNPAIAGKVVTGHIMRSDEINTVLRMLSIISNIDYYYKENIIHIK